jgi:pimeloyl-ACP methyl ester carboxylesterase
VPNIRDAFPLLFLAVVLAGAGGCWPAVTTPVRTLSYPVEPGKRSDALLVLLPGRGSRAADYARQGFVEAVRRSPIRADVVAVDAHLGYYVKRTLIPRLLADVITPARRQGYRRIVLVGISMGGLGSLLFARKHAALLDGVVVIAPFLGDPAVIDEVHKAGGLAAWLPPASLPESDYQRSTWAWLKQAIRPGGTGPRLVLGFGREDRMARSHRLLAAALPGDAVFTAPGGHDWPPWRTLWTQILASPALRAATTP